MNVSEALATRKTCRAFKNTPVSEALLRDILTTALRAPSGGNLQPWRVYAVTGAVQQAIVDEVQEKMKTTPRGEGAEYHIYPPELTEPYKTRRFQVG